jgi:hypothetical protein
MFIFLPRKVGNRYSSLVAATKKSLEPVRAPAQNMNMRQVRGVRKVSVADTAADTSMIMGRTHPDHAPTRSLSPGGAGSGASSCFKKGKALLAERFVRRMARLDAAPAQLRRVELWFEVILPALTFEPTLRVSLCCGPMPPALIWEATLSVSFRVSRRADGFIFRSVSMAEVLSVRRDRRGGCVERNPRSWQAGLPDHEHAPARWAAQPHLHLSSTQKAPIAGRCQNGPEIGSAPQAHDHVAAPSPAPDPAC